MMPGAEVGFGLFVPEWHIDYDYVKYDWKYN
jgi:hypothetical protein